MTRSAAAGPSRNTGFIAFVIAAVLLLALAVGVWFWLAQMRGGADDQARQLDALQQRQKELTAQLAAIGPPPPPVCKPGEMLEPVTAQPGTPATPQPSPAVTS